MAKKSGGKSTAMVSPLYVSGKTVGDVAGPKGGKSPADPNGYLSRTGDAAPSGSPADRPGR